MAKRKRKSRSPRQRFGWVHVPRWTEDYVATLRYPVFGLSAQVSGVAGSGAGKVALLHEAVTKVAGHFPVHEQTIGDCVSHGFGLCVDVLKCVEIALHGERESWEAETATEPIYAYSRVEVGGGRLGSGDGSLGSWGAKAVNEGGTLLRRKYGSYDFTRYSGSKAKQMGAPRAGVPNDLEPTMREHPVRTTSLVRTYEEARDAIANGYPVSVCSMIGFENAKRDSEGFARRRGQWPHCMAFVASDDKHSRSGLLCMNSWGPNWISGPKRHNQPDGSFWVDADTCNVMLREGDSFALSQFEGYPKQKLDWIMV